MTSNRKSLRLPDGFFVASSGDLVRMKGSAAAVRPGFAFHHRDIRSGLQLRATLRAGPYAWPGGYQLFLLTSDGAALCFDCGIKEFRTIARSMRDRSNDGWRIVACDVNYEDADMHCAHCNQRIPSAYGNDESEGE